MISRLNATATFLSLTLTLALGLTVSCERDERASPKRSEYNSAIKDLEAGQFETADKGFRDARNAAGQDVELRFRSAYNLGLTLAKQVSVGPVIDSMESKELEEARGKLEESASWFRAAIYLRPDDRDSRVNLEIVLRRIRALSDRLNKGQNSLEARLDRAIEAQRQLRDNIRGLTNAVAQSGNAAEPIEFQSDFESLATAERGLIADVNTVSDLAGEELGLLRDKGGPDGENLEDQDKVRAAQLSNLDFYLQRARADLGDTRRALRRLQGQRAHRRSDTSLRFMVRAREQLHDPVTVLKSIAQDQARILQQTGALAALEKGTFRIDGTPEGEPPPQLVAPPWLDDEHLGDRQDNALQRTREVLARFEAAVSAPAPDPAADPATDPAAGPHGAGQDPKQERMLQSAREAVPFLQTATAAMETSRTSLTASARDTSVAEQRTALTALANAIERFSDIRQLIELTYGDHMQTLALLTPLDQLRAQLQAAGADPAQLQALEQMPAAERIAALEAATGKNIERLSRLQGLFQDEIATIEAQAQAQAAQAAQQAGQGAQGADPHAAAGEQAAQQAEAAKQRYVQAEELRRQALESITQLSVLISGLGAGASAEKKAAEGLVVGEQGKEHIEELRRLFYSLIEHLKELIQEQTKTNDLTGTAASILEPEELVSKLGQALEAQRQHAAMGQPITDAVAQQADQAGQGDDQEAAERLAKATEELTAATESMNFAVTQMESDLESAKATSVDLSSAMEAQRTAIGHLEAALQLLQPPKEQQQDQQDQQDQEQQEQQDQQKEDVDQQQAERKLQEIRDREAERRRKQQQRRPEPVEKDW